MAFPRDLLIELERQITAVETDRDSAAAACDVAEARIVSLEAENATLRAEVADLRPKPPRPPMAVGAAVQGGLPAGFKAFEDTILGARAGARRWFDTNQIDSTSLRTQLAFDAGRVRAYSFKATATYLNDSHLELIRAANAADGFPTYLCLQHEAERPDKGNTPAAMRAQFDTWITKIRTYCQRIAPHAPTSLGIVPTVIYMSYLERDRSAATSTGDWFPTVDIGGDIPVCLGLDPYDQGNQELRELYTPTLDLWRAGGGTLWAITETGSHRLDDTDRARWITEGFRDAYDDGCLFITWFQNNVEGANVGEGWSIERLELDDGGRPVPAPKSLAAFKAFVPAFTG